MHSAQSESKHTAQLPVMQAAYDPGMSPSTSESRVERPFRQIRRERLKQLIKEAGTAKNLSRLTGTPDNYISNILKGTRGLGDDVATKLEETFGKPLGWMDTPIVEAAGVEVSDAMTPGHALRAVAMTIMNLELEQREQVAQLAAMMFKNGPSPALAAAVDDVTKSVREVRSMLAHGAPVRDDVLKRYVRDTIGAMSEQERASFLSVAAEIGLLPQASASAAMPGSIAEPSDPVKRVQG